MYLVSEQSGLKIFLGEVYKHNEMVSEQSGSKSN